MARPKQNPIFYVLWAVVIGLLGFSVYQLQKSSIIPPTVPDRNNHYEPTAPGILANWDQLIKTSPAPPIGAASARYVGIEFADFQCPNCAKVSAVLIKTVAASHGKFKLYFYHRPIPSEHPAAIKAAEAATIAASQGKFWQAYEMLFAKQSSMTKENVLSLLSPLGLNTPAFQQQLDSHAIISVVNSDIALDTTIHATVTPTLVIRDLKTNDVTITTSASNIKTMLSNINWNAPDKPSKK